MGVDHFDLPLLFGMNNSNLQYTVSVHVRHVSDNHMAAL